MATDQDRLLQFFNTDGMPEPFKSTCDHYKDLAHHVCKQVPSNPERTVALRKLLESRDCIVRALVELVK